MRAHRTARPARVVHLAIGSAALIIASVAAGHAQEGGFFEMLFGTQARQPTQTVAPAGDGFQAYRRQRTERRRAWRVKTRYAALPLGGDTDKIAGKQPVDQKAILDNPTKAILEDKTLRPGDIVVMPSGPKVFVGSGYDRRHRMSEFEDVKTTQAIDRKTRGQLLAMMVPMGAMPADQARKVMAAKRRLATQEEIEAAEAGGVTREASGPRMIMPWKTTR